MPLNDRGSVIFFIEPQARVSLRAVAAVSDATWRACESFFPGKIPRIEDSGKVVGDT
jgi:hypothetical protein